MGGAHLYAVSVETVVFQKIAAAGSELLEIRVDGRPLVELVREAEAECASQEGHPDLAGKYAGLPWETLATNLLLGEVSGIWGVLEANQPQGRVPLLICDCGEPGCWPLMASVDVTLDRVTWRDFRQPHRPHWVYKKLGPFSFDLSQYRAALEKARRR